MIGRPPTAPIVRFRSKVTIDGPSGCWLWHATRINGLYGQFWTGKRQVYAHRWSYEYHVGPIPDGLQIDHLCRVTNCVNPAHLEPVTARVNTLRSTSIPARNAAKTHCVRGHEFTDANTIREGNGRHCRACRKKAAA